MRWTLIIKLWVASMSLWVPPAEAGSVGRAMRAIRVGATAAKVYGRLPSGEIVMTVSELSMCIQEQQRVQQTETALMSEGQRLEVEARRIEALASSLERQQGAVNTADAASVAAFNAQVDAYRSSVRLYETQERRYNEGVVALNGMIDAFNRSCVDRAYYEDDYAAALRVNAQP